MIVTKIGVCTLTLPVFALQKSVVNIADFFEFLLDFHIRHDLHIEGFLE